jgi:hypothetical protein
MKKLIYMCILLMFTGLTSFSQEINKLSQSVPVTKGKIILKDGKPENYRNLNMKDDIVTYSDTKGNAYEKNISEVYKITKRGTYAGYGALMGLLSGLTAALTTEGDVVTGQLPDATNRGQIYLIATAGCTVLGGLVGLMFKKEKTLYVNLVPASFAPSVISTPVSKQYPMLSLKINF